MTVKKKRSPDLKEVLALVMVAAKAKPCQGCVIDNYIHSCERTELIKIAENYVVEALK